MTKANPTIVDPVKTVDHSRDGVYPSAESPLEALEARVAALEAILAQSPVEAPAPKPSHPPKP